MKFYFRSCLILTIALIFTAVIHPQDSVAQSTRKQPDSYVNVVIPLRGREYWQDTAKVTPLFEFLKSKNIPVTVLIQYSALNDQEIIDYLKRLPINFELGLFLEVDESLAQASSASYLYGIGDRAHSNLILLSAYGVSERKRMLDTCFARFKNVFGSYPESVGAWYIDSLSLAFIKEKYAISSVLDVADQWNTDTYGIWGKPWSVPYIPSKFNSLVPSQNVDDDSGLVKIQWAARDPVEAYGLTVSDSTYSVQANDYLKGHRFDISYFTHLSDIYLSLGGSASSPRQLTVGLEAGQEGNQFLDEFVNQINSLANYQFVTMSEFGGIFRRNANYPFASSVSGKSFINEKEGFWFNFDSFRAYLTVENGILSLKDVRIYDSLNIFSDVFSKDPAKNLRRIVPACLDYASGKQEIVLAENIVSIDKTQSGNIFKLHLKQTGDKNTLLVLSRQGIELAGKKVFSLQNLNHGGLLRQKFLDLLFSFQTDRKSSLTSEPLFSKISGTYFLGIPLYPDRLLAIKSTPPFIGIFRFSFQVLSKFKRIKLNPIFSLFGPVYIDPVMNCKALFSPPV